MSGLRSRLSVRTHDAGLSIIGRLKMPAAPYFNPRQVIAALVEADGAQDKAAALLGVSTSTISNYKKRWPEVAEACRSG